MGSELAQYAGKVIKALRTREHMSQEDLAKKLGVTNAAVSNYESGLRAPKQDALFDLAHIFGVSINSFFPQTKEDKERISRDLEMKNGTDDEAVRLRLREFLDDSKEQLTILVETEQAMLDEQRGIHEELKLLRIAIENLNKK